MNCKVKFILIPVNGFMVNVTATPKIIRDISASYKSVLYGFYDNTVLVNNNNDYNERHTFMIDKDDMIFIYGRVYDENRNYKVNTFMLPEPKVTTLPKIYGDIYLFKYNRNTYNYGDFTKDMWTIISIKK